MVPASSRGSDQSREATPGRVRQPSGADAVGVLMTLASWALVDIRVNLDTAASEMGQSVPVAASRSVPMTTLAESCIGRLNDRALIAMVLVIQFFAGEVSD
jgi:hypothetical protein